MKHFWLLRLITCFDVGNNFTTTNASNILSEVPCSLTKAIVLTQINPKIKINHGCCIHVNRKLALVLLLQIIILVVGRYVRLLSGDKKNIAVNLFSKLGWELGLYYASYDDFHLDILARMYT